MTTSDTATADTSTPVTPADPAAVAASTEGSLLSSVQAPIPSATPAQAAAATPGEHDWLPEKFRVMADGKLDEAASARKLAESYKALESHKGPLSQAPATPDDYQVGEIKGADGNPLPAEIVQEFTSDPLFKAFVKDAHEQGLSNDQLRFVVERYMKVAPELIAANQQVTRDEASRELSGLWKDENTFNANLQGALKAITGFGGEADDMPGSRARLQEKFGNDPDFLAFAAQVAAEMREDRVPSQTSIAPAVDIESLQKSEAYWNAQHPDHTRVKAQVSEFYTRKYGTKPR